ncbi:MAG: hypothetical protein CMC55_00955 [Flavobacteriaceae bacterium]|uniref:T9SS type A sorting domain-containing protein n=1 Tax=Bizionia echini TaxID=649333 RepID=UPI000C8ECAAA|nr:hypothetical protein [Flavobacteriaceae bacterium]
MKQIILLFTMLLGNFLSAQQLVRDNFNSGSNENAFGVEVMGETFNHQANATILIIETILDATYSETLSVLEEGTFQKIKMYPNPVESIINIEFETIFKGELSLIDATGKIILKKSINHIYTNINMSYLLSGWYILVISDDINHKKKQFKIIKN